jgi:DNA polymerase elongation subunit (family B)
MTILFQIYDYLETNEEIEDASDDEEPSLGKYIIHVFGRTIDNKSVYAKVTNYKPYFYILLPDIIQSKTEYEINVLMERLYDFLHSKENKKISKLFKSTLTAVEYVKLKQSEGFTNESKSYFAKLIFNNSDGMRKYRNMFEYSDVILPITFEIAKPLKYKLYESNLPPMFRCFHIKNISGCAWVKTEKYTELTDDDDKASLCNIELLVNWKHLEAIQMETNAPLKIASFDIECTSIDGAFPQARRKGDQIIQIGVTYTLLGQNLPYRSFIACLGETSSLDGIIVKSCKTERELLLTFLDEINTNDCDIMTGYNIFFFDEKYMYDRCKEILGIDMQISYMSKLKTHSCQFKEMKLASSALGENLLRYWDTPGRVHIDLMKDVQKTFSLASYKLDNVASKFIRGQIIKYNKLSNNQIELVCNSVDDIYVDDYVHLEIIKGFISDEIGYKYYVLNVCYINKTIIIQSTEEFINELEHVKSDDLLYWSQAKDDVSPKDIFRLQKGSADDRAIVAKYCIKDCKLVNILINKLEVVTKNIEMANVCFVPLSYLFIRGQGIKLFSLCLKEFREQEYAFPVIKIDKTYQCSDCNTIFKNSKYCTSCNLNNVIEIETEQSTYEGAIVFNPVPKVEYEACATKDYMSLYPASIMHKNMSHETIVEDEKYDNLPDITYYNAYYKEANGLIQYKRFAKKDNKLGVIPSILNNLLKTRKAIKNLMKKEKNPFKYKILDAKQLAVKITANSLYGQLGASTSPICKRDIAACTTSTGREMLIFAKKYDEEILPWIINGLKYGSDDIINQELKDPTDTKLINSINTFITKDMNGLIFQPIVRYGDTDSIFSCYRFRENVSKCDDNKSLNLLKQIIKFGKELILPFLQVEHALLFEELYDKYYSFDKIVDLCLPEPPKIKPESSSNKVLLMVKDRMKIFIKEYIEESYLPWLWTLQELVLKDYMELFDDKLYEWAEHQICKMRIEYINLYELRKQQVIKPILKYMNSGERTIEGCKNILHNTLADELIIDNKLLDKVIKNLFEKLKEKDINDILEDFLVKHMHIKLTKYKDELNDKVKSFVVNVLQDTWIQPRWYFEDGVKHHMIDFYEGGKPIIDKRTLDFSMELGKLSGELVKSRLPYPHDLEYEKTFWPFAILTKKRYVGNKYEFDNNKYKQDFMGIVLKRRDNAPIVKEICSGIIDQLINKRSPDGAKKFMVSCLNDMFEGKYDIRYFLQSRTLKMKESYKDWTRIAHVYLADKISKRDPGFTPQSGDRIEYVVIKVDNPENKKLLQGDIIEVPSYVKQNNLEIDYMFYLTNQIMNPALQFLELVDKNAKNLFQEFINKYSIIKVKKTTKKASQQAKTKIKELIKQLNVLRRTKCIVKTLKTNYKNLISIIKKMK